MAILIGILPQKMKHLEFLAKCPKQNLGLK
jgi:hypothetical protein